MRTRRDCAESGLKREVLRLRELVRARSAQDDKFEGDHYPHPVAKGATRVGQPSVPSSAFEPCEIPPRAGENARVRDDALGRASKKASFYSMRSACIGSMLAARRAGMNPARAAAAASTRIAVARVSGS